MRLLARESVWCRPDPIARGDQELKQEPSSVRLSVRFNQAHKFAGQTLECGVFNRRRPLRFCDGTRSEFRIRTLNPSNQAEQIGERVTGREPTAHVAVLGGPGQCTNIDYLLTVRR